MGWPLKVIATAGTLGAIGGAITFATSFDSGKKENIEKKLSDFGYLVLTSDPKDEGEWDKVLEAYNKIEKPEEIFASSKIKSETKDGLKQKCNLAISSGSAKDYYLTKRWCVKAETIKEMLERKKYIKLDPSSEAPDNKVKWKARTKLIAGVPENKRIIKISLKENDDDNNIALLKEECNKLNIENSKTHESNYFEQNYLKAKDVVLLEIK